MNQYSDGCNVRRWLQIVGVAVLVFWAFTYRTPDGGYLKAGWWGLLGIIGWTYCSCAISYLLALKKPMRILALFFAVCIVNLLATKMCGGSQVLSGASSLTDFTDVLKLGNGCFVVMALGGMLLSIAEKRLMSSSAVLRVCFAVSLAAVLALVGAILHHCWIISKLYGTLPWCLYVSSISV